MQSSNAVECCCRCCVNPPEARPVIPAYARGVRAMGRVVTATVALAALTTPIPAAADPDSAPTPEPDTTHEAVTSAGPAPIDRDGTFAVGTEILPGIYSSPGPLAGETCYWRRVGAEDTTVENALTKQPQTVQIDPTDVAFKTSGCQGWTLTDAPPPDQNPPWLSQLKMRHSLDILNGLAGQSGNGQLPPY